MTPLVVTIDDGTPVETASTVRDMLVPHMSTARVVLSLKRGITELLIGFRGDRGMCYWRQHPGDDLVSSGGDNAAVEVYGATQVTIPPYAEIDAAAVLDAAEEFATSATRPTCVTWAAYSEAMGAAPLEGTITPEQLQALLDEPDTDR